MQFLNPLISELSDIHGLVPMSKRSISGILPPKCSRFPWKFLNFEIWALESDRYASPPQIMIFWTRSRVLCIQGRLSVCLSVWDKSYHTSRHYFFLIFCNKLACYKCRKVTKPDFRRKIRNFFYKQFYVKKWGFSAFSRERVKIFGWNFIFR